MDFQSIDVLFLDFCVNTQEKSPGELVNDTKFLII